MFQSDGTRWWQQTFMRLGLGKRRRRNDRALDLDCAARVETFENRLLLASTTIDVRVSAAADDVEESATGNVAPNSSDLELGTESTLQTVGLRFNGVAIPQGATITGASLQFQTDEKDFAPTSLVIQGEKSGDAAAFVDATGNVSSRPRTTAAVSWNPEPWLTVGEAGPAQQTPDIQAVIQEIVDQPGWSSGNSLAIIVTGTGKRVAESYNGNPTAAPLLHVEFTLLANDPPVVTPATFSLDEQSANGTAVGTAIANDPDGHNITFSLTAGNTGAAFAIHPATGVVTVNDATKVDFETTPQFQLTVTATDDGPGNRSGSATVTVDLLDLDEAPLVQTAMFGVFVGSGNGTAVGTVTVGQIDAGQSVAFAITGGDTDGVFDIDAATGQITVADAAQLGAAPTAYALTVQATDNTPAMLSGSATVTIDVMDGTSGGAAGALKVRVNAASDDVEESATGDVVVNSSDLELVDDKGSQTVGMRFNGVAIPQGATITGASLQFQTDETDSAATSLVIQGEKSGDAAAFLNATGNVSSRPLTTAAVSWNPDPWLTVGEAGPAQQTPDIQSVIQEIVNQPGWSSGNSLAVIITGTGKRVAESYNGNPAAAPLLHVEYSLGPNNPPVALVSTVSTAEDIAYPFQVNDFTFSDPEGHALMSVTITNQSLAGGTLQHSGGAPVNNGDTLTSAQLATLVYTPPASALGSPLATFDFTVNDADSGVVSAQMGIHVTPVNDPPVAIANTVSTTEDSAYPFQVGDFPFSDAEGDALVSVTIANQHLVGGTLVHSGGATVNNGDTLSPAQLASLAYTPPANASGSPLATFDFIVNDAASGVVSAQMSIEVTPVNDPPAALANSVSTIVDNAYPFQAGDFLFADPEGDAPVSVKITNQSLAGGTLQHSGGAPVNNGDTLTSAQLATLVYTPPASALGSPLATFDFTVNDADSGVVSAQMDINVTPLNTPPVALASTVSTPEGNAHLFNVSDFRFSDSDGDALVSVTITNQSLAGGTLVRSGGATVNNGETLTAAQLDTLVYTPPANASGSPLATFDFTVNDADPGVVSAQMDIYVTPAPSVEIAYRVNAGGSGLSGTPAWAVDTKANPSPFHTSGSNVSSSSHAIDLSHSSIPEGTPEALFQTERWDPSGGNPLAWNFPVTPGDYEVRLYFSETWTGAHSVGVRTFDVSIEGVPVLDDYDVFATVGAWTGVVESFIVSSDSNLDIDFAHVVQNPAIKGIEILTIGGGNAPPVASANTVSTVEDSAVSFQVSDFPFSDAEGDALASVTITNKSLAGGTLVHSGGALVNNGDTLSPAQLETLVYTPPVDAFGSPLATFDFTVNDAAAGVVSAPMGIEVTPVNDSPVALASSVSTSQDNAYLFNVGDFSFNDPESDALASVTITNQSLAGGTLVHSGGAPVNNGETLTATQLATLVYTPPAGTLGAPLATFDFTVNDVDPGVVSARMDINVTSVNNPPVAVPNTVSTSEESAYLFQVGDFPFSDVEGDALASVTITNQSLAGGTLVHSGGTPVNNGNTLSPAQLDTLVYTPPADASGSPLATFNFRVNDAAPGVVAAQMDIDVISLPSAEVAYRVNAGGSELSGTPLWAEDTQSNPSPFHTSGSSVFSTSHAINLSHGSIPAGTPESLFQTERWDGSGGNPLSWDFPVTPGDYEVRLYFAEIWTGAHSVGVRTFDVSIEGVQVLDNYDVFATVGAWAGVMESFVVSSDSNLDIDFAHVVENPAIKGIEILDQSSQNTLFSSAEMLEFADVPVSETAEQTVLLTHTGGASSPDVTIVGTSLSGSGAGQFSDSFNDAVPVTLAPGESFALTVSYVPTTAAAEAVLTINHDGSNGPLTIALSGNNDPPVVTPATFSLAENSANGTAVGTVSASDPDGHNITYGITSGNSAGAFTIHPTSGVITVSDATQVDFEATPQFQLTVTVTDDSPDNRTGSAMVNVNILNLDEAPLVQTATFGVLEGSADGTVVGTVTAGQIDAGQSVAFTITAGDTSGVFDIDAATGQITVVNAAQLGSASTDYLLTVQATDNTPEMLSGSATITITVDSILQPVTFRAFGDTPYEEEEYDQIANELTTFASTDEFLIHVGDIKQANWACTEDRYSRVHDILIESPIPVFIVPGDNELTDCSDEDQAWTYWTTYFGEFDQNFSNNNFNVLRQAPAGELTNENFAFVHNSVLFIGIHIVGGSQLFGEQQMIDISNWVEQNFNAFGDQVTSAVLFAQAFPDPASSTRQIFYDAFVQQAQSFEKPILYLMGDKHIWKLDQPFPEAPNVTRVIVDGDPKTSRWTVTHDPNNPFLYDRDPTNAPAGAPLSAPLQLQESQTPSEGTAPILPSAQADETPAIADGDVSSGPLAAASVSSAEQQAPESSESGTLDAAVVATDSDAGQTLSFASMSSDANGVLDSDAASGQANADQRDAALNASLMTVRTAEDGAMTVTITDNASTLPPVTIQVVGNAKSTDDEYAGLTNELATVAPTDEFLTPIGDMVGEPQLDRGLLLERPRNSNDVSDAGAPSPQ